MTVALSCRRAALLRECVVGAVLSTMTMSRSDAALQSVSCPTNFMDVTYKIPYKRLRHQYQVEFGMTTDAAYDHSQHIATVRINGVDAVAANIGGSCCGAGSWYVTPSGTVSVGYPNTRNDSGAFNQSHLSGFVSGNYDKFSAGAGHSVRALSTLTSRACGIYTTSTCWAINMTVKRSA